MWLFLLVLFGSIGCLLLIFIFGLLRAGRRADKGEEQILKIISPKSSEDATTEDIVDKQLQSASSTVSVSEVSTSK